MEQNGKKHAKELDWYFLFFVVKKAPQDNPNDNWIVRNFKSIYVKVMTQLFLFISRYSNFHSSS